VCGGGVDIVVVEWAMTGVAVIPTPGVPEGMPCPESLLGGLGAIRTLLWSDAASNAHRSTISFGPSRMIGLASTSRLPCMLSIGNAEFGCPATLPGSIIIASKLPTVTNTMNSFLRMATMIDPCPGVSDLVWPDAETRPVSRFWPVGVV
jgi:hypothetical protein